MRSGLVSIAVLFSILLGSASLTAQGGGTARATPASPVSGGSVENPRGGTPGPLVPLVALGGGVLYLAGRRRLKRSAPTETTQV